jgi:hypothetical protein
VTEAPGAVAAQKGANLKEPKPDTKKNIAPFSADPSDTEGPHGMAAFNTLSHAASFRLKLTLTLHLTLARRLTGIRQLQHGRSLTYDKIGY